LCATLAIMWLVMSQSSLYRWVYISRKLIAILFRIENINIHARFCRLRCVPVVLSLQSGVTDGSYFGIASLSSHVQARPTSSSSVMCDQHSPLHNSVDSEARFCSCHRPLFYFLCKKMFFVFNFIVKTLEHKHFD